MLNTALKEWSVVCDLLLQGKLVFLLRKGGIHESAGPGIFELDSSRFLLFPSWAHQKPQMIKTQFRSQVQVMNEPDQITFHGLGEAAGIWPVHDRNAIDNLDDLHPWTPGQIDMRFSYKPQHPLYLVAIRAYRLRAPKQVNNHGKYAGCRSWVTLRPGDEVDDTHLQPALDDPQFDHLIKRIKSAVAG